MVTTTPLVSLNEAPGNFLTGRVGGVLVGGGRPAFGLASLGRVMMVRRGSRGAGDERSALVPAESGGGREL